MENITLDDYLARLKAFDHNYEFLDDHQSWLKWEHEHNLLKWIAKEFGGEYAEAFKETFETRTSSPNP